MDLVLLLFSGTSGETAEEFKERIDSFIRKNLLTTTNQISLAITEATPRGTHKRKFTRKLMALVSYPSSSFPEITDSSVRGMFIADSTGQDILTWEQRNQENPEQVSRITFFFKRENIQYSAFYDQWSQLQRFNSPAFPKQHGNTQYAVREVADHKMPQFDAVQEDIYPSAEDMFHHSSNLYSIFSRPLKKAQYRHWQSSFIEESTKEIYFCHRYVYTGNRSLF